MEIILNGHPQQVASEVTLSALLQSLDYTADKIAVAVDGDFVSRSQYQTFIVQAGQSIEVVAPMQGG